MYAPGQPKRAVIEAIERMCVTANGGHSINRIDPRLLRHLSGLASNIIEDTKSQLSDEYVRDKLISPFMYTVAMAVAEGKVLIDEEEKSYINTFEIPGWFFKQLVEDGAFEGAYTKLA